MKRKTTRRNDMFHFHFDIHALAVDLQQYNNEDVVSIVLHQNVTVTATETVATVVVVSSSSSTLFVVVVVVQIVRDVSVSAVDAAHVVVGVFSVVGAHHAWVYTMTRSTERQCDQQL
mmetsp:Transcript_1227/g.2686  ORF Transcript_1227/g.2686 Transcript_1227/m.2686 type:complete len:117 (+) Transcript_1227:1140-1490(+)